MTKRQQLKEFRKNCELNGKFDAGMPMMSALGSLDEKKIERWLSKALDIAEQRGRDKK